MIRKEFTIGLVVNPVAGMGGSVGLKGTDGTETVDLAVHLGAVPRAASRMREFLEQLRPIYGRTHFFTPEGLMGESVLQETIPAANVDIIKEKKRSRGSRTSGADTARFVSAVKDKADLIVFAGGDGTARDVLDGMTRANGEPCPVIGIPAGVKIHSGVFAVTPRDAALAALKFLAGEIGLGEGEVMDIDEDAFRHDKVEAKLYGYLPVPQEPAYLQGSKQGSPAGLSDEENKERIADHVVAAMEPATCYIIGPGSTTKPILEKIGLRKTLLGVDAVLDSKLVGTDMNEAGILEIIEKMHRDGHPLKLILTVIGAQGFLFGRGNLPFTPEVIRKIGVANINIILTRHKHAMLPDGKMRNDTRDLVLDVEMRGLYRVMVDEGEYKIVMLE